MLYCIRPVGQKDGIGVKMTMEKKTAAVIFGGQSSEHVVSCMSAANVIDRINTDKYN